MPKFILMLQAVLVSIVSVGLSQPPTCSRPPLSALSLLNPSAQGEVYTNENYSPDWEFHVAPMQGYTNASLRKLFRFLSKDAILWTEMEKVQDWTALGVESAMQRTFRGQEDDGGVILQLGGNDAEMLQTCVEQIHVTGYHLREINLNCGCPSIESGGSATYGASLMKQPQLTRTLLEAIHSGGTTPVSLKCRIAVFDTSAEMTTTVLSESKYKELCNYVTEAEQGGMSHLVLHARPAVLTGMSPIKNRRVPQLDYSIVERIAADFPWLRVTLNGGIQNFEDLLKRHCRDDNFTRITSHMAGRWMLRRPLDLARVEGQLLSRSGENSRSISAKAVAAVDKYVEYIQCCVTSSCQSQVPTAELCLPLYLVSEQLREDYESYQHDNDELPWLPVEDIELLYAALREAVGLLSHKKQKALPQDVNFKRLASSFKGLVGTKVANKGKRNRAEL